MAVTNPRIRWMIRKDLQEVMRIENDSFPHPWTEEEFVKTLRGRNTIGMVAEINEDIAGFMIYELMKSRIELLNFAVCVRFRRQGVGSDMIGKLVSKLSGDRRDRISLHVSERNLEAQLFLRAMGFKATSIEKKHYEVNDDDAYRMSRSLDVGVTYRNERSF